MDTPGTPNARVEGLLPRTPSSRMSDGRAKLDPEAQRDRDTYYLGVAWTVASRAKCLLGKGVGCVIVKENRIISTGYNGTPEYCLLGRCNDTQKGCWYCRESRKLKNLLVEQEKQINDLEKKIVNEVEQTLFQIREDRKETRALLDVHETKREACICVHAEQNAIVSAARLGVGLSGAEVYTTLSPCFQCMKLLLQCDVVNIIFGEEWNSSGNSKEYKEVYEQLKQEMKSNGRRFEQGSYPNPWISAPPISTNQPGPDAKRTKLDEKLNAC